MLLTIKKNIKTSPADYQLHTDNRTNFFQFISELAADRKGGTEKQP